MKREELRAQQELRLRELELKELQIKQELEIKGKELQTQEIISTLKTRFKASEASSLLPPFDETNVDGYFTTFESLAGIEEWPRDQWLIILYPKFVGKAQRVFNTLEQFQDYDTVKASIISAYEITPEAYRQRFRNLTKQLAHTFIEFATEKKRLLKKWMDSTHTSTLDDLVNLIILEELKSKMPQNILRHVEEKGATTWEKAAEVADAYALLLRNLAGTENRSQIARSSSGYNLENRGGFARGYDNRGPSSAIMCSYCKNPGHLISQCKHPNCKASARFSASSKQSAPSKPNRPVFTCNGTTTSTIFKPFIQLGQVSLHPNSTPFDITILRDTAAAQTILVKNALPEVTTVFTGEKAVLTDLSQNQPYPLAKVYLKCPLKVGKVEVAVREQPLPVPGVQMLLGNDLAGELVVPTLRVSDTPLPVNTSDLTVYPACAVTRSQSRLKTPAANRALETSLENLRSHNLSKTELIKAQQEDDSLCKIRNSAADTKTFNTLPCFYYNEEVLMRAYRPPEFRDIDSWAEVHQIVVPKAERFSLISLAHDGLAGHLGINKTYKKLLQHFFWPAMKQQVKTFVKQCHTCQVTGKPNEVIPPAPLNPILVTSEPFEKVVLDIVGPLPKTRKGNQYLLTLMDVTTRYPEVFPLKTITSKAVLKPLLHFFTTVGVPQTIQTDQGSNFTSTLFQEVAKELGTSHVTSSAYHPQSQGCLERFHQTLKSAIRKFCFEHDLEWDEMLDFLLFAIRECPQDSLGYSPFELLFGRQIRGPLKIVKDQWLSSAPTPVSVETYINRLRDKLEIARTFALNNLLKSQQKMVKQQPKAQLRTFKPGDKVLLFLPVPGSPLKAKYSGPYLVQSKLGKVNYIISTPDRRKSTQLVHVNLIKAYHSRESEEDPASSAVLAVERMNPEPLTPDSDLDLILEDVPPVLGNPLNSSWLRNQMEHLSTLTPVQAKDISSLLVKFHKITADLPGTCNFMVHDIELIPGSRPIKQNAYTLNPVKKDIMRQEVEYLLMNDLAEPSLSPWASPCILIPKPDGSYRFCTDYRKVNQVTVKDSFPLPRINDIIDFIGCNHIISTVDLLKGYYQIPLTPRATKISSFVTPFGLFQYKVLSFGMCNAPATFQRMITGVVQGLEGTAAYLDDIVVVAKTWPEHLTRLRKLFGKLQESGLTINLAKSNFGQGTVTYLGHTVGQGAVLPKKANVEAIIALPPPTSRKEVMRFLGMAGFYRRFCTNFSTVAAPLTNLTSTSVPFKWTPDCDQSFTRLKTLLSSPPVLRTPDFQQPFHLQVDASGVGIGAALLQPDPSTRVLHPVAYHSAKLKSHQIPYSSIEKESLALVSAVKKFECYLHLAPHTTIVFTDHNPLTFINSLKNKNQRILRWALFLQPYNLCIRHIKGVDNIIADSLSRAPM